MQALSHRGPDAGGVYLSPDRTVALGHRRLTIIDLSDASAQPFETKRLAMAYNGEIYNFRELREELQRHGLSFRSSGDTEVIAAGYEHWGVGIFSRLKGMFAVALYDKREQVVVLARDIFGIKPLYLRTDVAGLCMFGSEIKSLSAAGEMAINPDALIDYCGWGYPLSRQSLFDGIRHVEPGEILTLKFANGQLRQDASSFYPNTASADKTTQPADIRSILQSSVHDHMIADVPVAITLSGGLDSSAIAALASSETPNLTAFTFTTRGGSDPEVEHASILCRAMGIDHRVFQVQVEHLESTLDRVAFHLEEPVPNLNSLPIFALSAAVREAGYKVILVGEGSDELFAGYPWHALVNDRRLATDPRQLFSAYRRRCGLSKFEGYLRPRMNERLAGRSAAWANDFVETTGGNGRVTLDALLNYDRLFQLQYSQLHRIDRMTMAHSVEARVPYLYEPVLHAANGLPDNLKIRPKWFQFGGRKEKVALARSVRDILPKRILQRPKFGARGTVNLWTTPIARELDALFQLVLSSPKYREGREAVADWIDWRLAADAKPSAKMKLFLILLIMTVRHSLTRYQAPSAEAGISATLL